MLRTDRPLAQVWGTGTYGFSQQDLGKFYSDYHVAQVSPSTDTAYKCRRRAL
jgi:hypothetical protein